MPLRKETSKAAVSSNVKTMIHEWEKDGKVGNSHPATKQKAVKQAVAISLKKAGKSRTQTQSQKKWPLSASGLVKQTVVDRSPEIRT